jgi:hypothetical protein
MLCVCKCGVKFTRSDNLKRHEASVKCTGKAAPLLSPNQLGNLTCNKIDTLSNNTVSCSSDQIPRNVRKFDADDNLSTTMATDSQSILPSQNDDDDDSNDDDVTATDDDANDTDEDNDDALNNVVKVNNIPSKKSIKMKRRNTSLRFKHHQQQQRRRKIKRLRSRRRQAVIKSKFQHHTIAPNLNFEVIAPPRRQPAQFQHVPRVIGRSIQLLSRTANINVPSKYNFNYHKRRNKIA